MPADRGKAHPKRVALLHKLIVLFLGLLCGLLTTCKKPSLPLRVRIAGCHLLWERDSRLLCAVKAPDEQSLILSIEGPPLGRLRFQIGNEVQGEKTLSRTGHETLKQPFPKVASQVYIRADSDEGVAEYTLDVQPRMPFEEAYRLCSPLNSCSSPSECLTSAKKILGNLDADPSRLSAPERAFLRGMIGKRLVAQIEGAALEQEKIALRPMALSTLEKAIAEARVTGLLSVEAWALDRLGQVLLDQKGDYDLHLAAATLSDPVHARSLDECPEPAGNVKYGLSRLEFDLGNLNAAKLLASEAAALTKEFEAPPRLQVATRLQEALAAQSLQQTQEAESLLNEVRKQLERGFLSEPCENAKEYNLLAWIQVVARQGGRSAANPDTSFERVKAYLPGCQEQGSADVERAVLSTNQALFALLRAEEAAFGSSERTGQLDLADNLGRRAWEEQAQAGRHKKIVVQQDLAYLSARSALLRGKGQDALRAFAELEQLTSRHLAPYYRWTSQIGQADAHLLLGETAEARTYYERAESLLDRIAAGLPMTVGRQGFLRQFEAGTGRYLKLLLATPGAAGKILEVIRHARVRALRTYTRGPHANTEQSKTDELLAEYWKLLGEREAAQAQLDEVPSNEEAAVQSRLQQIRSAQDKLLESLYTGDLATGAELQLLPQVAGELLLACYPLPAESAAPESLWLCAGATASGTQLLRIAAPTAAAPEQAAQAILSGFAQALQEATRLRILPYGLLRDVPWASLPWGGGRLGDTLTVRYGVDPLVLSNPVRTAGNRAMLVTNPQQDLPGAQQMGERLRKELPAAGWQLDAWDGAPRRGGPWLKFLRDPARGNQLRPALAQEVVTNLPGAELFIYYGHAQSLGPGGWDSRLQLAEEGSISARDIMSLQAVPRKVLLIGCETAVSDREAPADEAGLAQAFVLRGSAEVLATTRKVSDATAAALVDKLAALGALRPAGPSLAAALRDATAALRARHPATDLDAFRVYSP